MDSLNRSNDLTSQLKKYFGYSEFRENQEAIIVNLLDKKDTVVIMPTGAGKSLCYQLPSLLFSGMALIVFSINSINEESSRSNASIRSKCIFS